VSAAFFQYYLDEIFDATMSKSWRDIKKIPWAKSGKIPQFKPQIKNFPNYSFGV